MSCFCTVIVCLHVRDPGENTGLPVTGSLIMNDVNKINKKVNRTIHPNWIVHSFRRLSVARFNTEQPMKLNQKS